MKKTIILASLLGLSAALFTVTPALNNLVKAADIPEGYETITFAGGTIGQYHGKFNSDSLPGGLQQEDVEIKTKTNYTEYVNNEESETTGTTVKIDKRIVIGSGLRFDTPKSYDGKYEFVFTITNLGTEAIHLDGYQISGSSEYKNSFEYANRYRMDIDINPDETKTFTSQYDIKNDNNLLTYFEADATMNSLYMGITLGMKEITEVTMPSESEEQPDGHINFDLPESISVSEEYAKTQIAGRTFNLPTSDQITNNFGKAIAGWQDEHGNLITDKSLLPEKITLSPVYAKSGNLKTFGNGTQGSTGPDYGGTITDGAYNDTAIDDTFNKNTTLSEGIINKSEKGRILKSSPNYTINAHQAFRFKTTNSSEQNVVFTNKHYRVDFTIENFNDSILHVKLYQILSQDKINATGTDSQEVVIEPNTVKNASLYIDPTANNDNLMTFVEFMKDTPSFNFGISMGIEEVSARPSDKFNDYSTMTSMVATYNTIDEQNVEIEKIKLRFGAIIERSLIDSATDYDLGIVYSQSENMDNTTFQAHLDKLEDKTPANLAQAVNGFSVSLDATKATVNYENGKTVENEDGQYYQFAAVFINMEERLTTSYTSAIYITLDNVTYLLDEATYSLSSLAARYLTENLGEQFSAFLNYLAKK